MEYNVDRYEGPINSLILEPEDWTEAEWATICKIFGIAEAQSIVISDFTLATYGVKKVEE